MFSWVENLIIYTWFSLEKSRKQTHHHHLLMATIRNLFVCNGKIMEIHQRMICYWHSKNLLYVAVFFFFLFPPFPETSHYPNKESLMKIILMRNHQRQTWETLWGRWNKKKQHLMFAEHGERKKSISNEMKSTNKGKQSRCIYIFI